MTQRTWELFQQADPARGVRVPDGDVEAVLRAAAIDITPELGPVRHRRWQPPRLLVAGIAFAAVAGVLATVLVLRPGSGRQPAAPVLSHSPGLPCLTAIADNLQAAPYDGQSGRYEYQRWVLSPNSSDTMTGGKQYTVQWTEDQSQWIAGDGSGRVRTVRTGFGYPNAASQTYYSQHPDEIPPGGTQTDDLAKGEYSLAQLPAPDPDAMQRQLYQPRENGPGQALVGASDLNRSRILDAAHRAALLRFLATTTGLTCAGTADDPAGRTGTAVGSTSTQTPGTGQAWQSLLLFDPNTGELLDAGYRAGTGPMVWSTQWLARGYSDTLG
jgi:hypothetical protein